MIMSAPHWGALGLWSGDPVGGFPEKGSACTVGSRWQRAAKFNRGQQLRPTNAAPRVTATSRGAPHPCCLS